MYGDSDSPLHAGFGTDRFVVEWPVDPSDTVTGADLRMDFGQHPDGSRTMPLLTDGTTVDLAPIAAGVPFAMVAIPRDIHAIAAADLALARDWRAATREALVGAMAAGYRVVGSFRDIPPDGITAYVVLRGDLAAAAFTPADR
jgi:predicted GNAT superfamily acetyltransferase